MCFLFLCPHMSCVPSPHQDVGFTDAAPTLAVALLADDSMLQVHPLGMRHIKGTGAGRRIAEWRSPGKRAIVRACCNERQVALALSGGEVMYFEMGDQGSLMVRACGLGSRVTGCLVCPSYMPPPMPASQERERKVLGAEITALAIGPIPEGRLRAPHLTVAGGPSPPCACCCLLLPALLTRPPPSVLSRRLQHGPRLQPRPRSATLARLCTGTTGTGVERLSCFSSNYHFKLISTPPSRPCAPLLSLSPS